MSKHHDLKVFDDFFQPIVDGIKRHEVRVNDRDYQPGDTVTFNEGAPSLEGFKYSGRSVTARITYVGNYGVIPGYVSFSIADVGLLRIE